MQWITLSSLLSSINYGLSSDNKLRPFLTCVIDLFLKSQGSLLTF